MYRLSASAAYMVSIFQLVISVGFSHTIMFSGYTPVS